MPAELLYVHRVAFLPLCLRHTHTAGTMAYTHRGEPEEAFEEDLDPYNKQLLDQRSESDTPVVSHYADIEKLGMFDTAGLIINRMIGQPIPSSNDKYS